MPAILSMMYRCPSPFPVLFFLLSACALSPAFAKRTEESRDHKSWVIKLKLKDQHGDKFSRVPEDASLVFVVGGKDVPNETQKWADQLELILPDACQVVRLLDLNEVPRIAAPMVARKIRKQIGEKPIRIFLDWKSLVAERFGIRVDIPVVVCLDENDQVILEIEGPWTKERATSVAERYE